MSDKMSGIQNVSLRGAADGLGEINSVSTVEPLLSLLRDKDSYLWAFYRGDSFLTAFVGI